MIAIGRARDGEKGRGCEKRGWGKKSLASYEADLVFYQDLLVLERIHDDGGDDAAYLLSNRGIYLFSTHLSTIIAHSSKSRYITKRFNTKTNVGQNLIYASWPAWSPITLVQ